MTTALLAQPDSAVLDEFIGRMIGDVGATVSAGLVVLGDRLGLYRAMADGEPVTAEQLAEPHRHRDRLRRGRGWPTRRPAATSSYDAETATYSLTPEQAARPRHRRQPGVLRRRACSSPFGALRDVAAHRGPVPHRRRLRLARARRRPVRGHRAVLPARLRRQPGVDLAARARRRGRQARGRRARRRRGLRSRRVDDPDGRRPSRRRPSSEPTTTRPRSRRADGARPRLAVSATSASRSPSAELAAEQRPTWSTMFDCLHDMGDPVGAARAARGALRRRRHADARRADCRTTALEENLNPIGRVFYGASTLICTPVLARPARSASPRTQAGPTVLTYLLRDAGFSRVRVASESPVNLIFEARP